MQDIQQDIQKMLETILGSLNIDSSNTEISVQEEEDGINADIHIKGENLELLIGYHGKNLKALQYLLGIAVNQVHKAKGKRIRLSLDVGEYFSKQQEKVTKMVEQAIEDVKLLDEPYEFKPMNPRTRRLVHLLVSQHPEVYSESKGEGRDRRVIIYPKNAEQV